MSPQIELHVDVFLPCAYTQAEKNIIRCNCVIEFSAPTASNDMETEKRLLQTTTAD